MGRVGNWQYLVGSQMKNEVSQTSGSLLEQMLAQNKQSELVIYINQTSGE